MVELLTSACPHTAMPMGLDAPTTEDHTRLVVTTRPTQSWFTITDHDGQAVDLNQPTAALMARAILRRLEGGQGGEMPVRLSDSTEHVRL